MFSKKRAGTQPELVTDKRMHPVAKNTSEAGGYKKGGISKTNKWNANYADYTNNKLNLQYYKSVLSA